ncbi:hypothetical protein GCM10023085_46010 [Actinomadura viridis]|uniref:Uncharacterized protein n=1 Tax=Actinomadura viridis TaxID=58110 RepID=A0A931GNW2_9ACTN|nr:hypothetical protein [Actinomadura viridis]MBG6089961.1 hypothetical protein [Actinomadura viridis]
MPLLDIQRRGQQIGRLRIGQQVPSKQDPNKMRPARLDTFRFTTQSRVAADAIAELYGGTVKDWNNEFEVITGRDTIGVTVPPRDQVVSQWYEMWSKGGCSRRCDSQIEQISGGPCQCPHADDPNDLSQIEAAAKERARLAALNPPQACKAITRISVMIPDLPGLGVFRLDTHSYYAAVEIGDAAALMQAARDQGVFLPAVLRIEHRQRVARGRTKKFPVPVLEVMATFRQIASGQLEAGGLQAQLPPPPAGQQRQLTSGVQAPHPTPSQLPQTGEAPLTAQQIADRAKSASTRQEIEALVDLAKDERVGEDLVATSPDTFEDLADFLRDRWRALPQAGGEKQ